MNANPYEPATVHALPAKPRRAAWRILPTGLFLLLGVALVGIVVTALFQMFKFYYSGSIPLPGVKVFVGAGVWSVVGIVCIAASVLFFTAKYRRAVYTALAAFAIFSIHAAIDAWL